MLTLKKMLAASAVAAAASLPAFAATYVFPDYATNRGHEAECFETGVCLISGHLSNGQHCWVEEIDSEGHELASVWGDSIKGYHLLEGHLRELGCKGYEQPAPAPAPTPAPNPAPTPNPDPDHDPNQGGGTGTRGQQR